MDLGEAIGLDFVNVNELAPDCKNNKKTKEAVWKARVNGLGTDTKTCSGGNLYDESPHGMLHRSKEHCEQKNLGYVPKKEGNDHWLQGGLDAVDPEHFPLQAHHLIPKNFLPKHHVCVWLCKNFDKNSTYKLKEDTYYNTDHANNGFAMPYATPLKEWKQAKSDTDTKCHVAYRVMEKTGIQLHQGSHAEMMDIEKVRAKIPAGLRHLPGAAGSGPDDMEEDNIHATGYLNQLKVWLDGVASQINEHVEKCGICKGKEDSKGKIQVQPLEDSVKLMNQVSYITKVFLQMNLMFTCPYGAAYAMQKDFITWDSAIGRYRPVGEKE